MPLNKPKLIQDLVRILTNPSIENNAVEVATELATAIDVFVKSGTVTVPSGVSVATTGTSTAQKGATTAPGIGTIS